jgi:hypothetical protein
MEHVCPNIALPLAATNLYFNQWQMKRWATKVLAEVDLPIFACSI